MNTETEVTHDTCVIILPTVEIYRDFPDKFYIYKNKSNTFYKYYTKGMIYKPDMITKADEKEIILPYLKEVKKFSDILERVEHVQDCNDIKENGPEARCYCSAYDRYKHKDLKIF